MPSSSTRYKIMYQEVADDGTIHPERLEYDGISYDEVILERKLKELNQPSVAKKTIEFSAKRIMCVFSLTRDMQIINCRFESLLPIYMQSFPHRCCFRRRVFQTPTFEGYPRA